MISILSMFTVKFAYEMQLENHPPHTICWRKVWKLHASNKVRMFIWRLLHESLPTVSWLANRGLSTSSASSFCGAHEENLVHALRDCNRVKNIWLAFNSGLTNSGFF
ncbi:Uncharacterized protein TCM_040908 [Theobroma cacao]|uniref:Reverse transcriptase zinc-binding domain-containing protein n=1 Tax=Theobroma cacao TaxID=3641 RepID=A0A061GZE5_THECC|nr:Uncharacterized protein TCM_040908 [Theobroma cacao]